MRNADVSSSSSFNIAVTPGVARLDTTVTTAESSTYSASLNQGIVQVQERKLVVAVPTIDGAPEQQKEDDAVVYQRGLMTIGLITLLFASNSPVLHMVFVNTNDTIPPPVFLLNAACSVVAMIAMLAAGPFLDRAVAKPSMLLVVQEEEESAAESSTPGSFMGSTAGSDRRGPMDQLSRFLVGSSSPAGGAKGMMITTLPAGMELGVWKFLGTLANMYGLSETSAGHGAFLIQLTTLFVPVAQGIMGVPIPRVIWTAILLALTGVAVFTQDNTGGTSLVGDAACVVAAFFYATYDLRLFHWGKLVDPLQLITTKIVTQTILSLIVLVAFAWEPSVNFVLQQQSGGALDDAIVGSNWLLFGLATLWSGIVVNAVAPFLQVGGQQAVGPARAQILYASQPLWAAVISWAVLHETVGYMGALGGTLFLLAIYLAATADSPDPNCETDLCEL
jgi:drug/metabolite transporter (DMT)-like permease